MDAQARASVSLGEKKIFCSRCKSPLKAGERFCSTCGSFILKQGEKIKCAFCGSPASGNFCPNCGKEIMLSNSEVKRIEGERRGFFARLADSLMKLVELAVKTIFSLLEMLFSG